MKHEREETNMKYAIKVKGTEYNEDYTFTAPEEGNIMDEVAAIIEEMNKGNFETFELKRI